MQQSTDVGAELSFILPSSASSQFPILFEKLEGKYVFGNVCTHYATEMSIITIKQQWPLILCNYNQTWRVNLMMVCSRSTSFYL